MASGTDSELCYPHGIVPGPEEWKHCVLPAPHEIMTPDARAHNQTGIGEMTRGARQMAVEITEGMVEESPKLPG